MSIFKEIGFKAFREIAELAGNVDPDIAWRTIQEQIRNHTKGTPIPTGNHIARLDAQWYRSIPNDPDYEVYGDPYYICDLWACWQLYSRTSVQVLTKGTSCVDRSFVEYAGKCSVVLDLGCGFGYTSAALKEIFPEALVFGTNIAGTDQFKLATMVGERYGFDILDSEHAYGIGDVDILFASEYFEHIVEPIAHALRLIEAHNPRFIITANTFNGDSIGHFDEYIVDGNIVPCKQMGRKFNKAVRARGYRKVDTKIWNNRPYIWERTGEK